MSAKFVLDGVAEMRIALRKLPYDLTDDTQEMIEHHAQRAVSRLSGAYPHRTGDLGTGIEVRTRPRQLVAGALVVNPDPHAHLFEHGTQARHNRIGANRGAMPAGNVFVPIIMDERRQLYAEIVDLLGTVGITVTGYA